MKNKIYLIYLISSIILISCNNEKTKVEEIESPYILVDVENGDKTKDTVEFMFDNILTDSLKISKTKIQFICSMAVLYGDWNAKYKLTYKYDDRGFVYYNEETDEILVSVEGTCKNAYGVPDNITNIISFNRKGEMIEDLPKTSLLMERIPVE